MMIKNNLLNILNDIGRMVQSEWIKTNTIRPEIEIDEYVIMPNHIHGIIRISVGTDGVCPDITNGHTPCAPTMNANGTADAIRPNHSTGHMPCAPTADAVVGADGNPPNKNNGAHIIDPIPPRQPRSLASFVAGFKAAATRAIHQQHHFNGKPIWQRNYYEHIIRNWQDLNRIRDYIRSNPRRWDEDDENPVNVGRMAIHPINNGAHAMCPYGDVMGNIRTNDTE